MSLIGFSGGPAARGVTRQFSSELDGIVGFTPTGVSYYDDRPYKDIIRKGEAQRSYYSARGKIPLVGFIAYDTTNVQVVGTDTGRPVAWGDAFTRAASGTSSADAWPSDSTAVDASMFCGLLVVALNNGTADARAGALVLDFLADRAMRYSDVAADGGLAQSLDLDGGDLDDSLPALVHGTANAVAISPPLPHYPLDEYGRPAFAIACATDGGVSVILPDADNRGKRVTDSASTTAADFIAWKGDNLYWAGDADEQIFRADLSDVEAGDSYGSAWLTSATVPALANNATALNAGDTLAKGSGSGVELIAPNLVNKAGSLRALLTSTSLSGWMPGDCKLALDLNAYAAGSVAEDTPLDDDFTGYADQAAAETAGWSFDSNTSLDATNDEIDFASVADGDGASLSVSVTSGETYVAEFTIANYSAGAILLDVDGATVVAAQNADGTYTGTFVAGSASVAVEVQASGTTTASVSSITIRRAYPDLSPANNGAVINGTLTAAAVETGADLYALSGFSGSNYLEVPYSSDFDMGTGDFAMGAWVKTSADGSQTIIDRRNADGSAPRIVLYATGSTEDIAALISDGSNSEFTSASNASLSGGDWVFALCVLRGDTLEVWRNARLADSIDASAVGSLTNTSAILSIGVNANETSPWGGSIALPRIVKGYAPTPEQIRQMYRDEAPLFREDAKAFLPSDTVNSLDANDGLLLIGTEGGAVIHRGFERLELLDSGDIGLTESGVDSVALLGGDDVMLVSGSEGVARIASRNLAEAQVIDAYRYERKWSGAGYTTDATPLDVAKLPLAEGESVEWSGTVLARSDDGSERANYRRIVRAYRDLNGDVTVEGADTLGTDDETTAGMDVAFAADTTAQTVDLQVTGVASTNIQWSFDGVLTVNKQ